jgi:hypothetical protein
MANYFARKAGNINATDVWATTPTGTAADVWSTFTSSDVLHSNNFAITVNVDTTVGEVRNDNANSANQGGSFTMSGGVTLTADIFAGGSNAACVLMSANNASVVGNAQAGTANGANAIRIDGTNTQTITGNLTGGGTGNACGARQVAASIVNITGNITGGSGPSGFGVESTSAGTVNITGDCTGGAIPAVNNNSTGTITITGSAIASNTAVGAINASTGILSVIRAVGNTFGIGAAGGVGSHVGVASAGVTGSDTRVQELEYGSNGQTPTSGAARIVSGTNNKCLVTLTTSAVKTLADPSDGTGQANEADVRSGVSYALGNLTGTCAVPAAGSVALGVAVDATTGTAVLTPAAVWDALTSGMTTAGSIGARLKNAATLDSTGQQLADALSPVP